MSGKESPYIRSLGRYRRPEIGERIHTNYGTAEILKVINYNEAAEEMERNGVPKGEIDGFTLRVEHFLKDRQKYFECLIRYDDEEFDMIDWSEYLRFRNGKIRR
jgi:hypothetical protein